MKKKNLLLKKISLKDDRFRISYFFSLEKLILSLEQVGLINPPLVTLRDSHYILVSGWKRALACFELSFTSLPVFVIEEEDELKTFLMAIYENLATRNFTLLEKAEILSRLKKFGEDEKKITQYYMPLLNIPPTLSHFKTFLAFSQFEQEVKRFIHEKDMSFSLVRLLTEFTLKERRLLLPLLLPLGQNKKKEILEDLKEVSRRNEIAAENILTSKEILDIQASERLSPLQKADRIRLFLRRKRYPAFTSWKDSFDSLLKRLQWPREIAVKPSPFFEEENFSASFKFKNREEFKTNILKLEELASKEEFSRIFEFK